MSSEKKPIWESFYDMHIELWPKLTQGVGILEGIDQGSAIPLSEVTELGNNHKPRYTAKR